jgi:hypothetical protein
MQRYKIVSENRFLKVLRRQKARFKSANDCKRMQNQKVSNNKIKTIKKANEFYTHSLFIFSLALSFAPFAFKRGNSYILTLRLSFVAFLCISAIS